MRLGPLRARALGLIALAGLLLAGSAEGSDWVTDGGRQPGLHADARGDVEVDWTQAGARVSLVVPLRGQVYHARLPGPDVSLPAVVPGLPFAPIVRRTPAGWFVALQAWQAAGQPGALHVARWKGVPTRLTLAFDGTRLSGRASFQGKPVSGFSLTPAGKLVRIYVYLDCFGCPAAPHAWMPMLGVTTRSDGSFSVLLRPNWRGRRYRAEVAGPNLGATLAPDAQAFAGGS